MTNKEIIKHTHTFNSATKHLVSSPHSPKTLETTNQSSLLQKLSPKLTNRSTSLCKTKPASNCITSLMVNITSQTHTSHTHQWLLGNHVVVPLVCRHSSQMCFESFYFEGAGGTEVGTGRLWREFLPALSR